MSLHSLVRLLMRSVLVGALAVCAAFAVGCSEPDPLGKSAADAKPSTVFLPEPDAKTAPNAATPKGRQQVRSIKQPRMDP
jgi:hypothetical protein